MLSREDEIWNRATVVMSSASLTRRILLSLALIVCLCSCEQTYTIDVLAPTAGRVRFQEVGGAWREATLTQQQILLVSSWMGAHQAEWHALMETPPLGTFSIELDSSDGRKQTMQAFVQPSGDGAVYAYGFQAPQRYPLKRWVSGRDIQELRAAAGIAAP